MNAVLRFTVVVSLLSGMSLQAAPAAAPTVVQVPASEKEIGIKATLVTPYDILVEWEDTAPGAAGYIVEWGTKPDDEFVPLGYFLPKERSYKHPDLMAETTCYYRVRAFYGPASPEAEISLPKELTDAEYKRRYDAPEDYSWCAPETIPDKAPVAKKSLRNPATAAQAAPTDFKLTLMPVSVSGYKLNWTDRASDEEGSFIEVKYEGEPDFTVRALVEPNVNKFGWAFGYPIRKGALRVRPYYFGRSSQFVHLKTGPNRPEKPDEGPASPAPAPAAPATKPTR
jgi:hypothetical protein